MSLRFSYCYFVLIVRLQQRADYPDPNVLESHLKQSTPRALRFLVRQFKTLFGTLLGCSTVLALKILRRADPHRLADFAGMVMRRVGPWLPEHKVGHANLAAAYPEKYTSEIERILSEMWDNLGRFGAEFVTLDRIWDFDPLNPDPNGRIIIGSAAAERFIRLLNDGKPALIFAAHLANWELPALASAANGLPSAVVYRAPNSRPIANAI